MLGPVTHTAGGESDVAGTVWSGFRTGTVGGREYPGRFSRDSLVCDAHCPATGARSGGRSVAALRAGGSHVLGSGAALPNCQSAGGRRTVDTTARACSAG